MQGAPSRFAPADTPIASPPPASPPVYPVMVVSAPTATPRPPPTGASGRVDEQISVGGRLMEVHRPRLSQYQAGQSLLTVELVQVNYRQDRRSRYGSAGVYVRDGE